MDRLGLILLLLLASPLDAQTTLSREYRSPFDSEGFQQPLHLAPTPEAPFGDRSALQVRALNKKGYLHRGRRVAEGLNSDTLTLQEAARIYSPSQSFIAITEENHAFMILHPQTSVSAKPLLDRWQYIFTGNKGLARISSHAWSVSLSFKPTDPGSSWQDHQLDLDPDSDIYIKYDPQNLIIYVLRGRFIYHIEPSVPLASKRQPGLLFDWEDRQVKRKPKAPYAIEVYAGQELTLESGILFQIGLPSAEAWQAPLLRTSPQLGPLDEKNKLAESIAELRAGWLKLWRDDASIDQLLLDGRYEEAYDRLTASPASDSITALKALCLFRLQQEQEAEKLRATVPETAPEFELLHEESLRSRLRRGSLQEISSPHDLRHSTLKADEIYLIAGSEQSQSRWRLSLDLWERWPLAQTDQNLQLSYKEWQRHLDQRKPFTWLGSAQLGWTDNPLHLPSGTAAPAEIGHRSSWFFRADQTLGYLLERSDDFRVQLETSFAMLVYQHSKLAELQRLEPGLTLPIMLHPPWGQDQTLRLRPYFSRLMVGSMLGLDRFGYEFSWQLPLWSWQSEFLWTQEQNLDFQPTLDHRLDALSGEPVPAIDRSVRRNTFLVRSGPIGAYWQVWDYRYDASQKDDRQRLAFTGEYAHDFAYDLQLSGRAALYQDLFPQKRDSVTALQIHLQMGWLGLLRLHPYFAMDRDMRQSGDRSQSFTETQWMFGVDDRW